MKLLVVLCLGLVVLQAESRALVREGVEDKCVEELELDEKVMRATVQKSDTPEDHEMYGSFYVCVWKNRGVMNDDATINSDALEEFLAEMFPKSAKSQKIQEKVINRIVDRCENVKGENEGQTGIKLKNCMVIVVNEIVNGKIEEEVEEERAADEKVEEEKAEEEEEEEE